MTGGSAVWSNRAAGEGRIDSADRGFLLGDGVFDSLTAFNGVAFEGDRHLARLASHADAIGIELDEASVRTGWQQVLTESVFTAAILRTTVTRGVATRGLWPSATTGPTIVVTASPWSPKNIESEATLITSDIRRNEKAPTSQLKSIGYLDNILAAREARARGADDALLLNTAGAVACTTIANIFLMRGSRLVTPPVGDGVLAGVMRGLVLERASECGLEPAEESLSREVLNSADLLFVTNSVRLLIPVGALDGRARTGELPAGFQALRAALAGRIAAASGYALHWS
ncbi:MAG: aminotransferase class IV [Rhodospirillaceae bacterium]|mgnify:CR=1 FL=1|nr:aminotransferase class IV [Rhodospirillaceae bacterium]